MLSGTAAYIREVRYQECRNAKRSIFAAGAQLSPPDVLYTEARTQSKEIAIKIFFPRIGIICKGLAVSLRSIKRGSECASDEISAKLVYASPLTSAAITHEISLDWWLQQEGRNHRISISHKIVSGILVYHQPSRAVPSRATKRWGKER